MKLTYFYNETTKEYFYTGIAQLDPLESKLKGQDVYLCPANATFEEILQPKDGFSQIWDGQSWQYIEDHRGQEYWEEGSSYYDNPKEMTELGSLPVGATITRPEKTEQELEVERLVKAKSERADYVSKIIVEVDDMLFDGDETSQDRMARSIIALNDGETVQWVLADNTIAQVTKEQLREALRKAGTAQTSIWSDPYTK